MEYNLTSNPFPSDAGVVKDGTLWADRIELKKKLVGLIDRTRTSRNSSVALLFGGYGQGKTHTLRHVESLLQDDKDVKAIYVPNMGRSLLDLYRSTIQAVGPDTIIKYAREFSGVVHVKYVRRILDQHEDKIISDNDFPNYVTNASLLRSELRKTIRELAGQYFPDFATVMIELCDPSTEETAWKWLAAQRVSFTELRELQVGTMIGDEATAVKAFKTLIDVLKWIKYETTYLLIDEGEGLTTLDTDESLGYTNLLRELIDLCPTGLVMIIACSAELAADFLHVAHQAFTSRIPLANRFELPSLSEVETTEFIKDYLKQARVISVQSQSNKDLLKPFEEKAVEAIFRNTKGVVRNLISACYQLIVNAAEEQRPSIDAGFCESFFKEFPVTSRQQAEK